MRPVLPLGVLLTWLGLTTPVHAAPPVVNIIAPTSAAEGAALDLAVEVSDPDGDTVYFTWDVDGDGVFSEFTQEAEITTAPLATDNPTHTISVQATDLTETTTVSVNVAIMNVPPTVTSEPRRTAEVRQPYTYDVRVEDPAGIRDPISYRLTSRPAGMEITGNHITWTPDPDQRGREVRVILRLDDGDGGEASQMWTIAVDANAVPGVAVPVAPVDRVRVAADAPVTFTVANASDRDEDPLSYRFQLSRTATFEGDLIESLDVPENGDPETTWTTEAPLPAGLWYWRVRAFDGMAESEERYAQVVVGDTAFMPDAGPGETGGGCSVVRGRRGLPGAGAVLAVGLVILLGARRRRG